MRHATVATAAAWSLHRLGHSDATSLDAWALHNGQDSALLKRLNPALATGISHAGKPLQVLAASSVPATASASGLVAMEPVADAPEDSGKGAVSSRQAATRAAANYGYSPRLVNAKR